MSRILLFDRDPEHCTELKTALQEFACSVTTCSDMNALISQLHHSPAEIVIVVFESSLRWRKEIELVRGELIKIAPQPVIICALRWPAQGPSDRLFGDELKVTVLHEI